MSTRNRYINREISWLSFNARVLQEAADPTVPLIERLKFMGIFSSNLDEFFRVRVGTMKRIVDAGVKYKLFFGETPDKILNDIQKKVLILNTKYDEMLEKLDEELKKEDIYIINER